MVLPRRSSPSASAARIMARAGRSFTLPPGLRYSSLARRWQRRWRPVRLRRTRGVLPMRSIRLSSGVHLRPRIGRPARSRLRGPPPPARRANTTTGSPASWIRWATGPAVESPSPTTPTSRGMWPRSSAIERGRLERIDQPEDPTGPGLEHGGGSGLTDHDEDIDARTRHVLGPTASRVGGRSP